MILNIILGERSTRLETIITERSARIETVPLEREAHEQRRTVRMAIETEAPKDRDCVFREGSIWTDTIFRGEAHRKHL